MKQIGNYLISKQIGFGSTSSVHLAEHSETPVKCCLKIIPKISIQDKKDQEHLLSEIKILQTIEHPNLVKFFEFFESDHYYLIVMEYIEGETLSQLINSNSVLTECQARRIFTQLIELTSFLHQNNIFHRDIKPDNIIVQPDLNIKLIDFGLSSSNPNFLSTFCGSFRYAAPECILCQPYKGSSADMWSLGVILYLMITGNLPWRESNVKRITNKIINAKFQIPKETPFLCADLISHLLLKDPSQRLTVEEVKKHQWLMKSSDQNPLIFPSRRKIKENSPKIRKLKWLSWPQTNSLDSQSNHYPFNLKYPEII
jgi:serine/threonine protein kinase